MENINNNQNENIIQNNNPVNHWSKPMTLRLQEYAFKSAGNSFINSIDAGYYCNLAFRISLATSVLSGLVTIGFGGILYFVQNKDNHAKVVLYWISTILSLLLNIAVMILNAYLSAKNPVSKVAISSVNAAKFGSLYRQIIGEFVKDPNDREDALTLHNHVLTRFNELESEKPFMRDESKALWEEYTKEVSNHPQSYSSIIKLPDEFINEDNTRDFNFKSNKNDYNDGDLLLSKDQPKTELIKQIFTNF